MKIHSFEWQCECGIKHDDIYAESVFPQECECGKTHCFKDVIAAQLLLHMAYGSLLDLAKRLADYVRMIIEIEGLKPNSPIGIAYRDFIEEFHRGGTMLKITITTEIIEWLCDRLGCEADEAEEFVQMLIGQLQVGGGLSATAPDATERSTSFVELKCHKCGAIIDATLTQMSRGIAYEDF